MRVPTRMIRAALLESDRFLALPDNTARVCYMAALLTADDRGNLEASPGRLVRMWRDFGIDSNQKATAIAGFLADQDLIRLYEVDGKPFVHIPRFGQRKRHLQRACPLSPWCKEQNKQGGDTETDGLPSVVRPTTDRRPTAEEKGSEEKEQAAPDGAPVSVVWTLGVSLLVEQGISEPTARSFLGGLLRDWDELIVADAVRAAVGKAGAKAYILGVLKSKPKKGQPEERRLAV